ncbi:MAG: hypothetical protein HFH81_13800 [Lachnospiraceae bacterium]|jgi:hypothetical protein|nr:hypothetical protein [Lachnospiraceae bacterium]
MKKKRFALLAIALAAFLATGITVLAANCPACESAGTTTTLKQYGEHCWHKTGQHTVQYSEGGVLYTEECRINYNEDKVSWVCPKHGAVTVQYHYKETHSSSHCNSLDYYH